MRKRLTGAAVAAALFMGVTLTPAAKAHAEPVIMTLFLIKLAKLAAIAGGLGGAASGVHALQQMQAKKHPREAEKQPRRECFDRYGKRYWVDAKTACRAY